MTRVFEDSMLAKQLTHAYVDFRMFYDRIRVSEYMEQIGRHIMRGPNELTIEDRRWLCLQTPFGPFP